MVLYHSKVGKTNWVMHQYYLASQEEGKEEEYVVSKFFYQRQTRRFGGGDNGEMEKNLLEEAEGPDYPVEQLKTNETMMDVSSPEVVVPSVSSDMQFNLQNMTDEAMVDVSSPREVLTPPALGEMQANPQRKGLFRKIAEEVETMWDKSFPQTVPAVGEVVFIFFQSETYFLLLVHVPKCPCLKLYLMPP